MARFRDGVGEGQVNQVFDTELQPIRDTLGKIPERPPPKELCAAG